MTNIQRVVESFATSRGLERWQTGYSVRATADEEWAENRLAVAVDGEQQPSYTVYRIEPRGANEYVVFVDGVEVWRGESADQALSSRPASK